MKKRYFIAILFSAAYQFAMACDACEKRQPKITQGLTHGTGPESNWDWVIVGFIAAITLLTLAFSLKYLIKPGEKDTDHIKRTVLSH